MAWPRAGHVAGTRHPRGTPPVTRPQGPRPEAGSGIRGRHVRRAGPHPPAAPAEVCFCTIGQPLCVFSCEVGVPVAASSWDVGVK